MAPGRQGEVADHLRRLPGIERKVSPGRQRLRYRRREALASTSPPRLT